MQRKGKNNQNINVRIRKETPIGLPPKQHLCLLSLALINAFFFNQCKSDPQGPILLHSLLGNLHRKS
jgi:hypothetical protein